MKLNDLKEARYYQDRDIVECPRCEGKGWWLVGDPDGPEKDVCPTCEGEGTVTKSKRNEFQDRMKKATNYVGWHKF